MLIDSHCHLHDRKFFGAEEAEKMLLRAAENDVRKIVCIGTDVDDSLAARDFTATHEGVFFTFGIHPNEVDGAEERERNLKALAEVDPVIFKDPRLVAIGEVGLDYHYENFNREAQIELFEKMLALAREHNLPVVFHVREAFDDFFEIIKKYPEVRGVVHSFTDSKKKLKRILIETDFYVGVNGLATYTTLPLPPLDRILLETDAPFLTPKPFRGIINESAYIRNIAEWLADKTQVEFDKIEGETTKNAEGLFNFSDSRLREA
ncbi:MAG: TatD family hydrolase [Candidatus Saccharibacteria bacterium]|nr:TatD family hydrolase [Candidatus Saccharibacteria bacterium]